MLDLDSGIVESRIIMHNFGVFCKNLQFPHQLSNYLQRKNVLFIKAILLQIS